MASRMPIAFRCSSVLTVASASPIAVPSVISTSSPEASSPDSASTCPTSWTSRGWRNWRGDRLTAITRSRPISASARHTDACRQAVSSTHRPIGRMRPVSSAIGMNDARRHQAALGMLPAHQRLQPHDAGGPEVHLGLVVEPELAPVERPAQLGLHLEPALHRLAHARLEHLEARAAVGLRPVHGDVGVAQESLGGGALVAPAERDPDAGAHEDLLVLDPERPAERLDDPLGDEGGVRAHPDVLEQHGELVAADARDGVDAPEAAAEALGDLDQELIAVVVPEVVVDQLEPVEVEEQHRGELAPARGALERLLEPVHEQHPVRQARQLVVKRPLHQLRLEGLVPADVPRVEDDPTDAGLVEQVGPLHLEPSPRAVAVLPAKLDRPRPPLLEQLGVEDLRALRVSLVDERPAAGPDQPVRLVAQDRLDRGAHVPDRAIGLENEDDVGSVLHEGAEALLARAEPLLLARQPAVGAPEPDDTEAEPAHGRAAEAREDHDAPRRAPDGSAPARRRTCPRRARWPGSPLRARPAAQRPAPGRGVPREAARRPRPRRPAAPAPPRGPGSTLGGRCPGAGSGRTR